jgi:glycerol-3-phosphate O-acyltransferase
LLAAGDRALSIDETMAALEDVVAYARKRKLPITEEAGVSSRERVESALGSLVENGVLTCFAGGPEAVYAIGPEQHLAAAFYRNTVAHVFVTGAIAELSLLAAAEEHVDDRERRFWNETLRLRDLLKFEFFFSEKDAFRREVADEVALHDPNWKQSLADGSEPVYALLRSFRPFSAHLVLRPFLEAYSVVADALERRDPERPVKDEEFLAECLGLGKQYRLQKRIRSAESVSKVLFSTALKLARNRQLLAGSADLQARRKTFAVELREAIRRVEAIEALAASRRARLID